LAAAGKAAVDEVRRKPDEEPAPTPAAPEETPQP
jgi:hypothetical protein